MNNQAKLLLSAYRPGGEDVHDPAFAEALSQAQRDPQLRTWLEESQDFDRAVAVRLRSVAVPSELRATILAGAKVSRPARWWNGPRFWALAAALMVLAAVAALWPGAAPQLANWQTHSLDVLDEIERAAVRFDEASANPAHLVNWLQAHSAPHPTALSAALAGRRSFGCKTIDAEGRAVSLICFDLGNKEQAHLFTTARAGLAHPPPKGRPTFDRYHTWNVASWTDGDHVHMLAATLPVERLQALIPQLAGVPAPRSAALLAILQNP